MTRIRSRAEWLALAAFGATGAWFVFTWALVSRSGGTIAYDIYQYYYPNLVYAVGRLSSGGHGLAWNPYQNCGQPFFGISSTGLLYPGNVFFLLFDADRALLAVTVFNMTVAGVGTFLLLREMGTSVVAAFCGALAFQLGPSTVTNNTWTPLVGGPYAWLPAAMLCGERLLRRPTLAGATALGLILSVALLPGFPQVVLFTYQLLALRLAWEVATGRLSNPKATLGGFALGLALPFLLTAVQLLPGLEMMRDSVRGGDLSLADVAGQSLTWSSFRVNLAWRADVRNPIALVPGLFVFLGLLRAATRRRALFYVVAGGIYFALAFGPNGPLFDLYARLPLGLLFRDPPRFLWMTAFCLAVLTALGVEALRAGVDGPRTLRRGAIPAVTALTLAGLYFLYPNRLSAPELACTTLVLAGTVLAGIVPRVRRSATIVAAAVMAYSLMSFPIDGRIRHRVSWRTRIPPYARLMPDGGVLYANASALGALRARMTAQDRVYVVADHMDYALEPKTAALVGFRSIQDYEPQPSRRYAEFFTMMRVGFPLRSLSDFYYPVQGPMPPTFKPRLLDLTAARYVVEATNLDLTAKVLGPSAPVIASDGRVRVYENPHAIPRATYVPRLAVVRDPRRLLRQLADGPDDPRAVALVEELPASGFVGTPGNDAGGTATVVVDEPERVAVRVDAPARGFLRLIDQHVPGWRATVDGAPAPIMRADYVFRVVEVPAGTSTVEFRYAPRSIRVGAVVSVLTILALVVTTYRRRVASSVADAAPAARSAARS
ncbi:MAG TPA: YfhO family protein [Candidatus Binatia bacterium]|nr:YfhO family protein [Candidatus Binatia bacterium]